MSPGGKAREPDGACPGPLGSAIEQTVALHADLGRAERRHRVVPTRPPDAGFAAAVAAWVRRRPLAESLAEAQTGGFDISAGDFVRWCRQVIDVLDQIRTAAPAELAPATGAALAALRRGVVAVGVE